MCFRAGPCVLCKKGCWRCRRRNTDFGSKKFFPPNVFPPTNVKSKWSARRADHFEPWALGSTPPPPPLSQKEPSRHNTATRRSTRRDERVTVQGPVKKPPRRRMSHMGGGGG